MAAVKANAGQNYFSIWHSQANVKKEKKIRSCKFYTTGLLQFQLSPCELLRTQAASERCRTEDALELWFKQDVHINMISLLRNMDMGWWLQAEKADMLSFLEESQPPFNSFQK